MPITEIIALLIAGGILTVMTATWRAVVRLTESSTRAEARTLKLEEQLNGLGGRLTREASEIRKDLKKLWREELPSVRERAERGNHYLEIMARQTLPGAQSPHADKEAAEELRAVHTSLERIADRLGEVDRTVRGLNDSVYALIRFNQYGDSDGSRSDRARRS